MSPPEPEVASGRSPLAVQVDVYDTTLRDGTQAEGISLSCDDKLRIARRLDDLGVRFIEGGWPGSNPKDVAFFERAKNMSWKNATIAAFGSTRRADAGVGADPGLAALLSAETRVCTIVGKSSAMHVADVLRTSRDENLKMIEESVAFLRRHDRRVIFDAEHFFDGAKLDRAYALSTLKAAQDGGAEVLVLCDTNGGSLPWEVEQIVRDVGALLGSDALGIHTHNDADCAVSNALAGVRGGVRHVQGTINGFGERCGNANLCALIPNLELKLGLRALPVGALPGLYDLAHFVAEVANITLHENMAYVGRSAFAHKGGIHVAAMRRTSSSYQHIEPERVGNAMRVVVSELSGRASLRSKAEELGVEISADAEVEVLEHIKAREAGGASFEAAEASIALMMRRKSPTYRPPFKLLDYKLTVGHKENGGANAEATIKIAIGNEVLHTVADGEGPVRALDIALRKALYGSFPEVREIQLVDYKVRILDGVAGTSAITRVLIDSRNPHRQWSTVGASPNIIEASWTALADSIEYGLTLARTRRESDVDPAASPTTQIEVA